MMEKWNYGAEYEKALLKEPGFIDDFCRGCIAMCDGSCLVDRMPHDHCCRRYNRWRNIVQAVEMAVI